QASGIEQVNKAILQMDQTTQQNAALVEQTAAASHAMGEQAQQLQHLMAFFKLDENETKLVAIKEDQDNRQPQRAVATKAARAPMSVGGSIDFSLAANKHLAWKSRLRQFLNGEQNLTEAELVSHRECDFGKWLYAGGMTKFGYLDEMKEVEKQHAEFHSAIKTLISLQREGRDDQARIQLGKIDRLSDKVVSLLNILEGKSAMKKPRPVASRVAAAPKAAAAAASEDWEEF
ncbi:MAG: CZB domain-containing protein, partial [Candidatus Competibacter sp.]